MSKSAMTVLGKRDGAELGITLPHEHLNVDIAFLCTDPGRGSSDEEPDWSRIRLAPMAYEHNLVLRDEGTAVAEVQNFADAGGVTIVDVTPDMTGSRDPLLLQRISQATGVNMIMGAGYYVEAAHPRQVKDGDCEDLAKRFSAEVRNGVGGTGVRPGVIGEIGTGDPMTAGEAEVVRAAAMVHREHGIPLSIHMAPGCREVMRILDIICDAGVDDLSRVIADHMDIVIDLGLQREVAARGAMIEYDTFGHEHYPDSRGVQMPSDRERVNALYALAEDDLLDRVLISQDICERSLWVKYGGRGYSHLLRGLKPMLNAALGDTVAQTLLIENPRRVFAYIEDDGAQTDRGEG